MTQGCIKNPPDPLSLRTTQSICLDYTTDSFAMVLTSYHQVLNYTLRQSALISYLSTGVPSRFAYDTWHLLSALPLLENECHELDIRVTQVH